MDDYKLFVIILNWNGNNDTYECIESLEKVPNNFEVILIDNGSSSDNRISLTQWLNSKYSFNKKEEQNIIDDIVNENLTFFYNNMKVNYFSLKENLGFAKGNNFGINYAFKQSLNPLVLLLNNDTIVESGFLNLLINKIESDSNIIAVTPRIHFEHNKKLIWNCGGKLTWFGNRRYYFAGENIDNINNNADLQISFITGCALLFRPKLIGLLTEKFFFGEEDFEFSLRVQKTNLKMYCVWDSVIYHKVGRSVNLNFDRSYNRLFVHYANRLIDHKFYFSKTKRFLLFILNVSYGFLLTTLKYKMNFIKALKFWKRVVAFAWKNDSLGKADFEKIMQYKI